MRIFDVEKDYNMKTENRIVKSTMPDETVAIWSARKSQNSYLVWYSAILTHAKQLTTTSSLLRHVDAPALTAFLRPQQK